MSESESASFSSRTDRSAARTSRAGSGADGYDHGGLIDQLPHAVLVVDADDRIQFANARAERLLEASRDGLTGTSLAAFVRPVRPLEGASVSASSGEREAHCTLTSREGASRRVVATFTPIEHEGQAATLVTLRNARDEESRTDALTRTVALFDEAFHLGPAALLIVRLRDGLVLEVSDRLVDITGLDACDLVGTTVGELDLDLSARERTEWTRALLERGELHACEFQFGGPDGERRPFIGNARRIQIDGVACALVSLIDVAEMADRVGAATAAGSSVRSTLLANLTHEVRTPLTGILGFTSVLREGVPEKYRRFVDLIDRSGRRLRLLLDSLLDLAQLEARTMDVHPEVCAVQQLVRNGTCEFVGVAREKGLDVTFEVPDACVYVRVDPGLFCRVLEHLVGNAVKFTDTGRVTIRVRADGDTVTVTVADTGKGIDAASIDRVLRPFEQESEGATRSHQGCGLGLTVSKRLLDRAGGRMEIESEKGEGTTVTIALPRETDLS